MLATVTHVPGLGCNQCNRFVPGRPLSACGEGLRGAKGERFRAPGERQASSRGLASAVMASGTLDGRRLIRSSTGPPAPAASGGGGTPWGELMPSDGRHELNMATSWSQYDSPPLIEVGQMRTRTSAAVLNLPMFGKRSLAGQGRCRSRQDG